MCDILKDGRDYHFPLESLVMVRTMLKVWSSIVQSQKYGVRVQLPIDEHVWDCSMLKKSCSCKFD